MLCCFLLSVAAVIPVGFGANPGILFGIYPPLFVALAIYSVGGTVVSIYLGRPLVGLNFNQEAREADFRWARTTVVLHLVF